MPDNVSPVIEIKGHISSLLSYLVSSGLIIGDFMNYLDSHAGAFGVLIGVGTFLMTLRYKQLERRDRLAAMKLEKDNV
jgi:hypothetical protein